MHAETANVRDMIDELMVRLRPFAEHAAHTADRNSTFQRNSLKEIQP